MESIQHWSENVILADADYVDRVAFDLTVNFERMLERRIPKASMAQWLDCVALDGGLRQGPNQTQVVLLHDAERQQMDNFTPGHYADELDGKAFTDPMGEFLLSSVAVERLTTKEQLFADSLAILCAISEVKRVMVIADAERYYDRVRQTLRTAGDTDQRITVFAMQPMSGGNFRQEILGYSLMAALGISSQEIERHR